VGVGQELAVAEARGQIGNPEEGKSPLLQAVTIGLMKTLAEEEAKQETLQNVEWHQLNIQ
jgi:hypothetical protein